MNNVDTYVNLAGFLLFLLSLAALLAYADGGLAVAGLLSLLVILAGTLVTFLVRK